MKWALIGVSLTSIPLLITFLIRSRPTYIQVEPPTPLQTFWDVERKHSAIKYRLRRQMIEASRTFSASGVRTFRYEGIGSSSNITRSLVTEDMNIESDGGELAVSPAPRDVSNDPYYQAQISRHTTKDDEKPLSRCWWSDLDSVQKSSFTYQWVLMSEVKSVVSFPIMDIYQDRPLGYIAMSFTIEDPPYEVLSMCAELSQLAKTWERETHNN